MNVTNSAVPNANVTFGQVVPIAATQPTTSSSSGGLSQVVAELTSTITGSDGKLDTSTPLGQMLDNFVKKELPDGVASQVGDPAQSLTSTGISQSLTKMIQDVMGPNSHASASTQNDLKSLVQGNLSKYKLDGLLTPNATRGGSNFSTQGIDPDILAAVGQFMDANPDTFPPPDQGAGEGSIGGWTDELSAQSAGDNYLNGAETDAVTKALGMIGQALQSGVPSDSGSSNPNDSATASWQPPSHSGQNYGNPGNPVPTWAQALNNVEQASNSLLNEFSQSLSGLSGSSGNEVAQNGSNAGFGQGNSIQGFFGTNDSSSQGFFGSGNNAQGAGGTNPEVQNILRSFEQELGASSSGGSNGAQSSFNDLMNMMQGGMHDRGHSAQGSAESTSQYIMSKMFS